MKNKTNNLLKKQQEKLDDPDFDLEVWKTSAIALFSKIFGKDDVKIEQLKNLRIDYSSWAMRDSNAQYKPLETCKKKGREIVSLAIDEIEIFGTDQKQDDLLKPYFSQEEIDEIRASEGDIPEVLKKLKKGELRELVVNLIR